jgi:glycosyltransferase involved in cell wall biosynthesis
LEVLLDIWPRVKCEFPKATLDIYYGWQSMSLRIVSPVEELRLRTKVASLAFLDVTEHGRVSHDALTRAFERSSFWTYPCTYTPIETFCITALRAQFAGAVPVVITGSALRETVRCGYQCLEAEEYLPLLLEAMRNAEKISVADRLAQRRFILKRYTWESIAAKWLRFFEQRAPLGS